MKHPKRAITLLAALLLIFIAAYFVKEKLSCFKINYQLQHSDIEVVQSDSAQYFEQFKNEDETQGFQLSLIEFGGQGCRPCMRMDTILEEISQIYGPKLNLHVIRLTDRENRKYAKYLGVQMVPSQVILNTKGEEVFRHTGLLEKEVLQAEIDKHL